MKKKAVALIVGFIIATAGVLVWRQLHPPQFDATQYHDVTQQKSCIVAYNKQYPDPKDRPSFGPPCPGVPQ